MSDIDGDIWSVSEALDVIRKLKNDPFITEQSRLRDTFPFGVWFRGHEVCGLPLEPRVFRPCRPAAPDQKGTWDETNIFEHLRLRVPGHQRIYHTAFEWLCLMQHYSVSTRLLDWSESILPALYFAAGGDAATPGELFVLNARRLNQHVKGRSTISSLDDTGVISRSEMATERSAKRLKRRSAVRTALTTAQLWLPRWMNAFRAPVAAFPSRLNERMVFQASVFTLHGGKVYPTRLADEYKGDRIPSPVRIEDIDSRCGVPGVLKRYRVHDKKAIRADLLLLGIHEGTLFPEVDRQAVYLEELWWYRDG